MKRVLMKRGTKKGARHGIKDGMKEGLLYGMKGWVTTGMAQKHHQKNSLPVLHRSPVVDLKSKRLLFTVTIDIDHDDD